jgi:hypothetical protein
MTKRILMCDPPSGWKYGFPRAVPEEGTIHYGGMDYGVRKEFDILEWIFSHGYPKSIYEECGGQFYCKYWTVEACEEDCAEQEGKMIYSGSLFNNKGE